MSMRINTAIGWGMPVAEFHRLCRIPGIPAVMGDDWHYAMEEALAGTGNIKPPSWPLATTGPNDTCFDLISLIGYDDPTDILFYPSVGEMRQWHRRNDDIDYAFHFGPRGPDDHALPETRVDYLETGFHPYGGLRMNLDGSEATPPSDSEAQWEWERNHALLPGVPLSLRHWTFTVGLLDLAGVARLRPLRAIWWS